MKHDIVRRCAATLGDFIDEWLISPLMEVVDAMLAGKLWGFAAALGCMSLSGLMVWGLSALTGGLAAPLGGMLRALVSWLPGSSLAFTLLVFLGAVRLATLPLRLSHARVGRETGKRERWLDELGTPSGKSIVFRLGFALFDAVLLFLLARALDSVSGATQQWLLFSDWGVLATVIFTIVAAVCQAVVANIGVVFLQRGLISRAERQMGSLGPCLSSRDSSNSAIVGVVIYNFIFDLFIYLPALAGLCIVFHQSPYRLTIVAFFLLVNLASTVLAHGLSVCLDWWSDSR